MNSTPLKLFFNRYWILMTLVAVKLGLQFALVNPIYELHRDEFLYLDQAFHLAAGYISVPPFTSWMATVVYILGGELFWIRLFPALLGGLTVVFGWLIVEELGGRLPAKIVASVFIVFSVYTRLNVLFQPNSFDFLAWTVVFYTVLRYIKVPHPKWLLLLSLIITAGFYNKYTIAFLVVGLSMGILLTEQRSVFTKKALWYAIALSLLLLLPNIIWQITNQFPVLHLMQALKQSQLVYVNRIDFLLNQVKYGVIGVPTLAAFWALILYKPFKPYRFVIWTFLIIMLLFTISRAKSYYTLGLYPVLFAFGSVYLEALFKKWAPILMAFLALSNIIVYSFIVKFMMPCQNPTEIIVDKEAYERFGLLRWEDGLNHPIPQDFADMLGWKELAEKALTAYQLLPANERQNTLIYCDNYGQAGALNYYNRKTMPEAYSFSTDYIYWLPEKMEIHNMLFVGKLPGKEVINLFHEYKTVGRIENEFAREKGTTIFLFLGAKRPASEMFYKMANERKKNFEIF